MKHTIFLTAVVLACSLRLDAGSTIKAQWNDVCKVTMGRELTFTTVDGATVEGYCMSINVDELSINTKDHRIVKIARTTLSKIRMRRRERPLKALRRNMHEGLKLGFDWLFSEYAPLGIVMVPGTLAWGVIAAPFSVLGELRVKIKGEQEIQVI